MLNLILQCLGLVLLVAVIVLLLRQKTASANADNGVRLIEAALRSEFAADRTEAGVASQAMRSELASSFRDLASSLTSRLAELATAQTGQLTQFNSGLSESRTESMAAAQGLREEVNASLRTLSDTVRGSFSQISETQAQQLEAFSVTLRTHAQSTTAAANQFREQLVEAVKVMGEAQANLALQSANQQSERLEAIAKRLTELTAQSEQRAEELRKTVDERLEKLRVDNEAKLEQMRLTVDEKLQSTLETRLGESFKQVSERLEQVHKGLGEMQTLATGVGDLKRVLSNVKARGGWGEAQLESLLVDMLTPDQFSKNVKVQPESNEIVEFAVRLPGRDEGKPVFLPIDAKFPQEDYERLVNAHDGGAPEEIDRCATALERAVRIQAKQISEKYIHPPHTTDFAIMYLPTEGLFAEVIRRPGLAQDLQSKHRIMVTGPTTLAAMLSSLQMGFRTLAIEKRSSEVWQVLGAAKAEFSKYGDVWEKLGKQLDTARKTVSEAGTRTRQVEKRLRAVETLDPMHAEAVLALPVTLVDDEPEGELD